MLFSKKKYLDWESYKNRIDFLDTFFWQQKIRNENIKRIVF